MKKISFISLGCSKNQVDSEVILGLLSQQCVIVDQYRQAQYIFINTCGFIESAKKEAIDTILEMVEFKTTGVCEKLIVMGCLTQRYKDELIEAIPEVDLWLALSDYPNMPYIFAQHLDIIVKQPSQRRLINKPFSAYLKVADGCGNCCSYCAIPLIRGSYKSFSQGDLLNEAKWLLAKGVKEIVLIAQDTTRYGQDIGDGSSLISLLESLNELPGDFWLRILYMYPNLLNQKLIDTMKRLDKVLMYFDVPMQHGSDSILRSMNRKGSTQSFIEQLNYLKSLQIPYVLRTTMMVGFPGESSNDIKMMEKFISEVRFDKLGVFTYSKEEDTLAYNFENQISRELANKRRIEILNLQQKIAFDLQKQLIGNTITALIEEKNIDGYLARSLYQSPDGVDGIFYIVSNKNIELGSFVEILITKVDAYDMYGEII